MSLLLLAWSVIFTGILIWLTWKVCSKLHAHVTLMKRIRDSGVPGFRGYPVVGLLHVLIRYLLFGPKHIPTAAALLPIALGMAKVFNKEGMFLVDGGWIKQVIVLYTKEATEAVLNDPKEQKKSDEYKFVSDFIGEGLLTAPYGKWRKLRRVLSPAFNFRVTDSFQPVMYDHAHNMVQLIKSKLRRNPIAIEDLLSKCSLSIITETAMGVKFESQSEENVAYVTAVREVLKIISKRIISPWLWPDTLFRFSPSGMKLMRNMKTVHAFVREIIQIKKAEINEDSLDNPPEIPGLKRRPFLELLLMHNVRCSEADKLTDDDILDEALTITFAGFDTVSATLHWTIYYMGLYPEVMKKAWSEVNSVLQGDKEREIGLDELKEMHYLERVIKEAQRIRATVSGLLRILRHDITVGEITLPKGATVAIGLEILHTRPDVFPDAGKFDPDRFADAQISAFQFLPFSVGPRTCIGQRLAVLEMKTVLCELVRHLDWKSLDPEDEVLSNPEVVTRAHKQLTFLFWERP